jgi:hypothetical protein
VSYIDARHLTVDQVRASLLLWRGTGLAVLVSDEVRDALGGPPDTTPEPRPLAELVLARTLELQQQIRTYVDTHLPPNEREGLAALLQKVTILRGMGLPVNEGASLALVVALDWVEAAMAMGHEVAVAAQACTTAEELQALTVDLSRLGPPPNITSGQIAAMLRS